MTTAVLIAGNMCDHRLWSGGGDVVARTLALRGLAIAHADTAHDATIAGMAGRALAATAGSLLPIGFSMGGIVALEMARQAGGRIVGLVLADANAGADLPERASVRPAQQARVRRGELATIVADELKPAYLAAANRDDASIKAHLFDMAMTLGDDVFVAQSEALRTRADAGPVLNSFAGPLLLLAGAEDTLCPPAWHHAMAARSEHATVAIVDGAGHMLPIEQPHTFAAALGEGFDHQMIVGETA